jgi:hypothetical protein
MISKKLGYYGIPIQCGHSHHTFNNGNSKTTKKEVDLLAKALCSVDSFQIHELVYIWQVVKLFPSLGFKNTKLWNNFIS